MDQSENIDAHLRGPPGRDPEEASPVFQMIMGLGGVLGVLCLVGLVYFGAEMERPEGPDGKPMGLVGTFGHAMSSVGASVSTGVKRVRLYTTVGGMSGVKQLGIRLHRGQATAEDFETLKSVRDLCGLDESFLDNAREGRISDHHARQIARSVGFDDPIVGSSTLGN